MGGALITNNTADLHSYAEHKYNSAVTIGQDGSEWLRIMVEAHLRRYPEGVDSKHPRNDKTPRG